MILINLFRQGLLNVFFSSAAERQVH